MKSVRNLGILAAVAASTTFASSSFASLMIDLRVDSGAAKSVTVANGAVVNLDVYGIVSGADADTSNEGLQSFFGSFVSSLTSGGSAIGNFSAFTGVGAFNTANLQGGKVQDLNGQPGLDVGSTSVAGDYVSARAASMQSGNSFLLGTLSWTVTSVPGTGSTTLNFVPRSATRSLANGVWRKDGATVNGGTDDMLAGTPVTINVASAGASVSLTAGGSPTVTIPGNNHDYTPTVVATPGNASGSTSFQFAGTHAGDVLVALDLSANYDAANFATVFGNLNGATDVTAQYKSAFASLGGYDVVLDFANTGSGPFTFNYDLAGGVTVNAIAVVPEPTAALAALPAVALLGRRRRA